MAVKNILCFGDSNAYGLNTSGNPKRFERRWTREIQSILGSDYYIIEDGLCGRGASSEDVLFDGMCGYKSLFFSVKTHLPLDMVIIMLGTNDLKKRLNLTLRDVYYGLRNCVNQVRASAAAQGFPIPKILLIAPTALNENIFKCDFGEVFDGENGIELSKKLPKYIESLAKETNCLYMDANEYVSGGAVDGLHFDEKTHIKFAEILADKLREML